jgi:hypothetical protein
MDNHKLSQIYMAALQAAVADLCVLLGDDDLIRFKNLIKTYTEKGIERVEANQDMHIRPPDYVIKACK